MAGVELEEGDDDEKEEEEEYGEEYDEEEEVCTNIWIISCKINVAEGRWSGS